MMTVTLGLLQLLALIAGVVLWRRSERALAAQKRQYPARTKRLVKTINLLSSSALSNLDKEERCSRLQKPVEILEQRVPENPENWEMINRLGDLYLEFNNPKAAIEQYIKVARHYTDKGSHRKAVALWKKVLRTDPSMLDGLEELEELFARLGWMSEAKTTLNHVADEYHQAEPRVEDGGGSV